MNKYFVFFFIILLTGCAQVSNRESSVDLQESPLQIEDDTISASGTAIPAKWANLAFPAGGKDLDILVTVGQDVRQDHLLALVYQRNAEYGINIAEAQLASANAILGQAEDSEFSNDQEIEAARAAVKAAEAGLDQARLIWIDTHLFSPISGTIIDIYLNPGEIVSPGIPVMLIADLTTLQVQTNDLNEVDVTKINLENSAVVVFDALPDTEVTGTVIYISRRNAEVAGVYYTVTIELDEIPDGLLWGMSAFVKIKTDG